MADDTHKIALELVLEGQEKVNEGLKKTAKDTKTFGAVSAQMDKLALRHTKERTKLDKKLNDPRKRKKGLADEKASNRAQKERLDLLRKQNAEIDAQIRKMQRVANAQNPNAQDNDPRGRQRRSGLGAGFRRLAGGAALSIAGAGIGLMSSQIRQGYAQYNQYGAGLAGLGGTGTSYGQAKAATQGGARYGYDQLESVQQARQLAMATGGVGSLGTAQAMSRQTTMDMGATTSFMGQLTQAGQGFGGAAGTGGNKQLQNILALGFKAGIDKARLPEYMKGVSTVVAAQAARQGGDVDATKYAGMLRAMGAFGGSGLQGARGADVYQRLNEAIVKPGGGEAGQAMMLQAMGFGKPGGSASYYEALKRQEQGATPENVKALFSETGQQKGGGEAQILALRTMTGLSITQLEKLRETMEKMSGAEQKSELKRILDDAKPPEEKTVDHLADLLEMAKHNATVTNHAISIGEQTRKAIMQMQTAINDLVTHWMPAAVALLRVIADVGSGVTDIMSGGLGGTDKDYNVYGLRKQVKRKYGPRGKFTGEADVSTNLPGMHGQFDPALLYGGGKYNEKQRKAISSIISSNKGLQSQYNERNLSNTPDKDKEWLKVTFGPGGLFYDQVQKVVDASYDNAAAAESVASDVKKLGAAGKEEQPTYLGHIGR